MKVQFEWWKLVIFLILAVLILAGLSFVLQIKNLGFTE